MPREGGKFSRALRARRTVYFFPPPGQFQLYALVFKVLMFLKLSIHPCMFLTSNINYLQFIYFKVAFMENQGRTQVSGWALSHLGRKIPPVDIHRISSGLWPMSVEIRWISTGGIYDFPALLNLMNSGMLLRAVCTTTTFIMPGRTWPLQSKIIRSYQEMYRYMYKRFYVFNIFCKISLHSLFSIH